MFLYFDIQRISPNLNLGSLSLISLLESVYVLDFTSTGFILVVLWYVLLYLFTTLPKLSMHTFFDIEVKYVSILFFTVLIILSETTGFPSLCVECIFISFFSSHDFIGLL